MQKLLTPTSSIQIYLVQQNLQGIPIHQLTYRSCIPDNAIDFNLVLISICVFCCTSVGHAVGMAYVQIQDHLKPSESLNVHLTECVSLKSLGLKGTS